MLFEETQVEAPVKERCENCGSEEFEEDYAQGYVVCSNCSATQRHRIVEQGAEWRDFTESGDPTKSRVAKVDSHINEFSTVVGDIAFKHGDFQGANPLANRLASTQKKIGLSAANRSLMASFDKLSQVADRLDLADSIRSTAKNLLHEYEEKRKRLARGAKSDATMVAILFMACKKEGFPRTIKELSRASNVDEKEINKQYRTVAKLLPQNAAQRTTADDLVPRILAKLNLAKPLEYPVVNAIKQTARDAEPTVEGRQPPSIAGAVVFLISKSLPSPILKEDGSPLSDQDIAEAAGVSVHTIRTVYSLLVANKAKLIPADFAKQHQLI